MSGLVNQQSTKQTRQSMLGEGYFLWNQR